MRKQQHLNTSALNFISPQPPQVSALAEEAEDHLKSATAWTLGQIGRHTPDHAKAVSDTGVLAQLVSACCSWGVSMGMLQQGLFCAAACERFRQRNMA